MIDRNDLRTVAMGAVYGVIIILAAILFGIAVGAGVRAFLWASGL